MSALLRIDPILLKEISDHRLQLISKNVDYFTVAMNNVADGLREKLIELLQDLSPQTTVQAKAIVDLQTALQGQLNKLDFDGKVKAFVAHYDDSQQLALQSLAALKIEPAKLAPLDQKALEHLKAIDYKYLSGIGTSTIQAVATGVVQNSLQGTPRARIIDSISSTLDTGIKHRAVTYADTGLVSFDRRASMAEWKAAGLTTFLYRGPKDIKNRTFCADYAGKTFTLEEIKALDQVAAKYSKKPLLPVIVYGGGWNCRHVFTPIPNSEQELQTPNPAKLPTPNVTDLSLDPAVAKDLASYLSLSKSPHATEDDKSALADNLKKFKIAEAQASPAKKQTHLDAIKTIADKIGAAESAAAAAQKAAEEAAAKKALEELAAKKLAEEVAAKKAAEIAKIAGAKTPSELIVTEFDPETNKTVFSVLGNPDKKYQSSGGAYYAAEKIVHANHPEVAQAKAEKTATKKASKEAKLAEAQASLDKAKEIAAAALQASPVKQDTTVVFAENVALGNQADSQWADKKHVFLFEKTADVGGAFHKDFYRDENGDRWLFKPTRRAEDDFLVYGDEVAYKVSRVLNPDTVEARAITLNGKFGSIQKLRTDLAKPADFAGIAPTQMSASDISQIQREQVLDWLISNHDAHAKQFLRTKDGEVLGIDKTQAFKFLGKDKLSIDYHPNKVEAEPLYNTILRAAKDGSIKIDAQAIRPTLDLVSQITDAQMLDLVKPYADSRFATDPNGLKKFNAQVLARKNGIRSDFETLYSQVTGTKVSFGAEPEAQTVSQKPQNVGQPVTGKYLHLNEESASAVGKVSAAKWQGQELSIDKDQIEDHSVLVFEETGPDKQPYTVLRMKIRPDGTQQILDATGVKPEVTPAYTAPQSFGYAGSPLPEFAIVPPPAGIPSIGIFKKLVKGEAVEIKTGSGYLTTAQVENVKKMAADYKLAVEQAQKAADTAQKDSTPAPAQDGFTSKARALTLDSRRVVSGGGISVAKFDAPASTVLRAGSATGQEIAATWPDGARMRFIPATGGQSLFAMQGTLEMTVSGSATPQLVDQALEKLGHAGISVTPTTPDDRERLYLTKAAYAAGQTSAIAWKQAEAIPDENLRLRKMREFWAKRLGVEDITTAPGYNPDGKQFSQWNTPGGEKAGYRRFDRFDLPELEKEMKGYTIFHSPTYGGGTLTGLLEGALPNNAALISTVEKSRIGVLNEAGGKTGASPEADLNSGGAAYTFTRIRKSKSSAGIYFKLGSLRRMDAISYNSDKFGRTTGDTVASNRAKTVDQFKAYSESSSNETIFKNYLSFLDELDVIKSSSPAERDAAIALFKKHGIEKLPDGRPIEKVIL